MIWPRLFRTVSVTVEERLNRPRKMRLCSCPKGNSIVTIVRQTDKMVMVSGESSSKGHEDAISVQVAFFASWYGYNQSLVKIAHYYYMYTDFFARCIIMHASISLWLQGFRTLHCDSNQWPNHCRTTAPPRLELWSVRRGGRSSWTCSVWRIIPRREQSWIHARTQRQKNGIRIMSNPVVPLRQGLK